MCVIGAVGSLVLSVFRGGLHLRFSPGAIPVFTLSVLSKQLAFGLKPMRSLISVWPAGLLPNLMSPTSDVCVAD
jgi:hypothetical protein